MDVNVHMDVVRTRGQYPTPPPRTLILDCPSGKAGIIDFMSAYSVLGGGEIGSTNQGSMRSRLGCDPVRNANLVNDNDNFVMEDIRLAA